jgi:hypothetical protein
VEGSDDASSSDSDYVDDAESLSEDSVFASDDDFDGLSVQPDALLLSRARVCLRAALRL